MLRAGPLAIAVMHHFEACRLRAYKCPAGIWTIGWGDTGPHVREGLVWTRAQADEAFRSRLAREFEPGVRQAIGAAPTTPAQFGAMVCLAYNIGVAAFSRSRVCSGHRAGRHDAAAAGFGSWTRGGGRVLPGLVRRRNVERLLYEGHLEAVRKAIA
jgi:lysozyme